jgi:hypothetical protein
MKKALFVVVNKIPIDFHDHWYASGFKFEVLEVQYNTPNGTMYWIRHAGWEDGWYVSEWFKRVDEPFIFR